MKQKDKDSIGAILEAFEVLCAHGDESFFSQTLTLSNGAEVYINYDARGKEKSDAQL